MRLYLMLLGDRSSMLVKVLDFIKPEEFYSKSLYLLFSQDRTFERENETRIARAFKSADLTPQRLVVEEGIIFLECGGYGQAMAEDLILYDGPCTFTRFFLPATYHFAVGRLPSRTAEKRTRGLSYTFTQI